MLAQAKEETDSWAENELQSWEDNQIKKQNLSKYEFEVRQLQEVQEFRLRQLEEV